MDAQIGSVVSGSHHLLRLLRRLTPFIPKEDIAVVVGTIINSRLDYANALYLTFPKYQITRLQVVQNTAARLVTCKNTFKALCLVHKCIQGNAPNIYAKK